jgi:DNA-binding beta-propeller fold protein YncE
LDSRTAVVLFILTIAVPPDGDCRLAGQDPTAAAGDTAGAAQIVRTLQLKGTASALSAIALTPGGTLMAIDGRNEQLLRIGPGGRLEGSVGGKGSDAQALDDPRDVAAPDDMHIYVADYGNNRVVRFDKSLGISSVFETPFDAPPVSDQVQFRHPVSVSVSTFGKLLVVEGDYGRIIEIDEATNVSRVFGGIPRGAAQLSNPVRIRTLDNSTVCIQHDPGIAFFDPFGSFVRTLRNEMTGPFRTFTTFGGMLFLLDSAQVRVVDAKGNPLLSIPIPAGLRGRVTDLQIDADSIYLAAADAVHLMGWKRPGKPPKN